MKNLLCLAILLVSSVCLADSNFTITAKMLQFTYTSDDGSVSQDCTPTLANADTQDWNVVCGTRKYLVHLWVTIYDRPVLPKESYEVLYWITDLNAAPAQQGASTTVWFHFREPTDLYMLQLSLGIEGDAAELQLSIDPGKSSNKV